MAPLKYRMLSPGDAAPWFTSRTSTNPNYEFSSAGGRYLVLCFLGNSQTEFARHALQAVLHERSIFNDEYAAFYGISHDPVDEKDQRLKDFYPGYRFLWDTDLEVGKLYGAIPIDAPAKDANRLSYLPRWFVLDPTMRVMKRFDDQGGGQSCTEVMAYVKSLPPPSHYAGFEVQAPVLILPNVFEPDFCQKLIGLYEKDGGKESGFMRETDGKTVLVQDHRHKRRRDYTIENEAIMKETQGRIVRRIVPEIAKVHQFHVTRMERYIVCCYSAEDAAHFNAHRDNTTKATEHRRFAVSINLNDDFEGGEVKFPEYGPRSFKVPAGGAVVFSCSLLHAVTTVTRGRRYAFLPFLYDDAAAKLRESNNQFLGEGVTPYSVASG